MVLSATDFRPRSGSVKTGQDVFLCSKEALINALRGRVGTAEASEPYLGCYKRPDVGHQGARGQGGSESSLLTRADSTGRRNTKRFVQS